MLIFCWCLKLWQLAFRAIMTVLMNRWSLTIPTTGSLCEIRAKLPVSAVWAVEVGCYFWAARHSNHSDPVQWAGQHKAPLFCCTFSQSHSPDYESHSPVNRLRNCGVRVSVFGSKSLVFLAVCGQIWQKFWGLMILGQVKSIQNFC